MGDHCNRMRKFLLIPVFLYTVSSEDFKMRIEKRYSSTLEGNPEFWPVRGRRTFWNASRPNFKNRPLDEGREYLGILGLPFFLRDPREAPLTAFIRYLERAEPRRNNIDEFESSGIHEIANRRGNLDFRTSYKFNETTDDNEHSSSVRDRRVSQNWRHGEPFCVEEPRWIRIDANYNMLDRAAKEDRPIFVASQDNKLNRFKETEEVIDKFEDYYPDSFFSIRGRRNLGLTKPKKLIDNKNLIEKDRESKIDAHYEDRIENEASELGTTGNEIDTQSRKESNDLKKIEDPFVSLRSERSVERNVVRDWKDPEGSIVTRTSKEVAEDDPATVTISNGSKNDEDQPVVRRQKRNTQNNKNEKSNDTIKTTNEVEEDDEDENEEETRKEKLESRLQRKRTDRRASRINRYEILKKRKFGKTIDDLKQPIDARPVMFIFRRKKSNFIFEDKTKISEKLKDVKKCFGSTINDKRKETVRPGERPIFEKRFDCLHPRSKHFNVMNVNDDEPFFISRGKKSLTNLHGADIGILKKRFPKEDRYSRDLLFSQLETSIGLRQKLKCKEMLQFLKSSPTGV